jgi:hypothetical protein
MDDYDDFVWVRLTELAPKGKEPRTAVQMVSEFEWFTTVNNERFRLGLPMIRTIPQILEVAAVAQALEWGAYCTAELIEDTTP